MLVHRYTDVRYLNKIKDSIVKGFQIASKKGALLEDSMRGICFELCEVVFQDITKNDQARLVIPAIKRIIQDSQLSAKPSLVQQIYLVEFQGPE